MRIWPKTTKPDFAQDARFGCREYQHSGLSNRLAVGRLKAVLNGFKGLSFREPMAAEIAFLINLKSKPDYAQ